MDLQTYRTSKSLSLEECAVQLGLSPTSKSWLSDIEQGKRAASLRLAMKIENWSGGKVRAARLSPIAAELARGRAA